MALEEKRDTTRIALNNIFSLLVVTNIAPEMGLGFSPTRDEWALAYTISRLGMDQLPSLS